MASIFNTFQQELKGSHIASRALLIHSHMTSVGPNGPARATALSLLSDVLNFKAASLRRKGCAECDLHSYILTNCENIHHNNSSNAVHLTQLIHGYNL